MAYTHPTGRSMPEKLKRTPSTIALSTQNSNKSTKASKPQPSLTEKEEEALQRDHNISLQAKFKEATAATSYPSTHDWAGRQKYSPGPTAHSTSTVRK